MAAKNGRAYTARLKASQQRNPSPATLSMMAIIIASSVTIESVGCAATTTLAPNDDSRCVARLESLWRMSRDLTLAAEMTRERQDRDRVERRSCAAPSLRVWGRLLAEPPHRDSELAGLVG